MSVRQTGYHIRETCTPHLRSLVATLAGHLYGLKWLGTSTVLLYSVSSATDNSCSRAKSAQVNAYEGKWGLKRGFQLCVLVEGTKLSAGHAIQLLY